MARKKPLTPIEYLLSVMNDPTADPELRNEAATALLPYLYLYPEQPAEPDEEDEDEE